MRKFVIVPGKKFYFFDDIHNNEIYIEEEPFLSQTNRIISIVQRIIKKLGLWRLYGYFVEDWKKKLVHCDDCIIFDQAFSTSIIKVVKEYNPNINIHVYLWNPILGNKFLLNRLNKISSTIQIYSFDKNDCNKYGFIFSPMIYNFNSKKIYTEPICYDVIFVGYLKNRDKILTELYNKLNIIASKSFFYVLGKKSQTSNVPFQLKNEYLSYEKYMKLLSSSKAVLEIIQDGQVGLTIRTMESICYEKKLITNNYDIVNYDFYNSNNIFIIGKDDYNTLKTFVSSPYQKISSSILRKYNFNDWVRSFSNTKG